VEEQHGWNGSHATGEKRNLTPDKLTVEVVRHALSYLSEEMGVSLRKSAYSPNIRERADHSCAILDQMSRSIGQAEHIPVHIGSLPLGLRNTLQYLSGQNEKIAHGDMFMVNDPYIAGTHLNDVTLIRPVFLDETLVAYTANKAHHVDVGGKSPGSISCDATELIEEGVLLPPTRLLVKNEIKKDVLQILIANTRMPEVTLGDLRAQIAANLLGERKLLELISKIGIQAFVESSEAVLDQTYRLAISEYSKMPKGSWTGEDYLELDDELLTIRTKISFAEDGVAVDFGGTSRQVQAPLNAVLGVTTAAVTYAIRTIMPFTFSLNDGFIRTITIAAPTMTIVNPAKPAPVSGGNLETSQRIVDSIYDGLSKALPDRIPAASHGSMNNLMLGGVDVATGKSWAFYETIGGGYGGRPGSDGVNGIQVNMTNTLNTPIEVIEHYYPIRFLAYELRSGTGGPGKWRGGTGIARILQAKQAMQATILGERCKVRPKGANGGLPGQSSAYSVQRTQGGQTIMLKSKDTIRLAPGDILQILTAGGGGYGNPQSRELSLVREDIENDYISIDMAKRSYGYGAPLN